MKVSIALEGEIVDYKFGDESEIHIDQPKHGWTQILDKPKGKCWWFNTAYIILIGPE